MKKSIIAGASVLALAGAVMPMAGVFADPPTPTDDSTDTITVKISPSCTFTGGSGADGSYEATGTNNTGSVAPKNTADSNVHSFTVFCNNNSGYKVHAATDALKDPNVSGDVFSYTVGSGTPPVATGTTDSTWHAQVATSSSTLQIQQLDAPASGTATEKDIATLGVASATGGESFSVTYSAYIGTETPAGNYTGNIVYTLTPNS